MRLLILGGTRFVGWHIAEVATANGHAVTLFNRGQSDPAPTLDVEMVRGDRDGGLAPLRGRRWDAVIDTSGYVPRIVRASADLLAGAVDHYTFISTVSVYAPPAGPPSPVTEASPLERLDDETREDFRAPDAYGGLKVLCERAVDDVFSGRALHVRLSLVAGPRDPTDRFTYWPVRAARGGDALAFDRPGRPVIPFVDVRDAAEWTVAATEQRLTGPYNVGGRTGITIGDVVTACGEAASGVNPRWVWVGEPFLLEQGVTPTDLPLWRPNARDFLARLDSGKAMAVGLRARPLVEVARDVLEWDRTRPAGTERRAGMSAEREADLLRRWRSDGSRSG